MSFLSLEQTLGSACIYDAEINLLIIKHCLFLTFKVQDLFLNLFLMPVGEQQTHPPGS